MRKQPMESVHGEFVHCLFSFLFPPVMDFAFSYAGNYSFSGSYSINYKIQKDAKT